MQTAETVYVDHVTRLGETHEVVATEDIHNQQGVKVVAKGTRVNRAAFDRLVQHKLLKPIDESVQVDTGVTLHTLVLGARKLIDDEPQIGLMLGMLRDPAAPMRAIGNIHLEPAFAVKLTVAREQLPTVYAHSLKVAVASSILGYAIDLSHEEVATLAMAGLFHDLGELHIDPAIFEPGHALTDDERRQIYAHPSISYAMLAQFPAYHPRVSRVVLEHHERLDGSGYPHGRSGEEISLLGRVLALGELAVGVCERKGCEHLGVLLRFQAEKYGKDLVQRLAKALHNAPSVCVAKSPAAREVLRGLAATLETCIARWQPGGRGEAAQLVGERIESLKRALARTGLPVQGIASFLDVLEEGSPELAELEVLLREALYFLRELGYELRRRWPALATQQEAVAEWMRAIDRSVGEALAKAQPKPAIIAA